MRAREYFEGIRAEVERNQRAWEMLERMRAKEGAKAQSYGAGASGGYPADPMAMVAKHIDFEARLRQRVDDANDAVAEACRVLYGRDNHGGLAKLKGDRYADAICMAYLQAEPWDEIADVMQCTQQWCRKLCDVGFAYIDTVGWAKVINT